MEDGFLITTTWPYSFKIAANLDMWICLFLRVRLFCWFYRKLFFGGESSQKTRRMLEGGNNLKSRSSNQAEEKTGKTKAQTNGHMLVFATDGKPKSKESRLALGRYVMCQMRGTPNWLLLLVFGRPL